jgi:uncharacterized membrane protein YphA (DoxX/SURF4 family)
MKIANIPPRLTTGAFVLHSGLAKWKGDEATAAQTHGFASGAFPFLKKLPPKQFLRLLAAGEIGLGAALLTPLIPDRLAGAGLSAFSGSLVALYLRTPGMRKPGSIWPTPQGIGLSKDVWMLGVGLGLSISD